MLKSIVDEVIGPIEKEVNFGWNVFWDSNSE
jgi:hypothetical protein